MNTLFDLSTVPTKADVPAQEQPQYKYYLRGKRADGKTYILWKTHDGEGEYYPEDEPNGRKPRFWNTLQAAENARKVYGGSVEVMTQQTSAAQGQQSS